MLNYFDYIITETLRQTKSIHIHYPPNPDKTKKQPPRVTEWLPSKNFLERKPWPPVCLANRLIRRNLRHCRLGVEKSVRFLRGHPFRCSKPDSLLQLPDETAPVRNH